jgi:hypothetical protein
MPKTKTKSKAQRTWLRRRIFELSYQGVPRSEIAEELGITEGQVDYYLTRVFKESMDQIDRLIEQLAATKTMLLARLIPFEREYKKVRLEIEEAVARIEYMERRMGYVPDRELSGRDLAEGLANSNDKYERFEEIQAEIHGYVDSMLRKYR